MAFDTQEVDSALIGTGLFTPKTEYLIIGDEPKGGAGVVNIAKSLTPAQYQDLLKFMAFVPREYLWAWFFKNVYPTLPATVTVKQTLMAPTYIRSVKAKDPYGNEYLKKPYEEMLWAAFINVFNEANLKYINENKLDPWAWEKEKLRAYYLATNPEALKTLDQEVKAFQDIRLAENPKVKSLLEQYAALPPLGDVGLEISRENAVRELLRSGEFDTVQAIIDVYRYALGSDIAGGLVSAIPFDILTQDGIIVHKSV